MRIEIAHTAWLFLYSMPAIGRLIYKANIAGADTLRRARQRQQDRQCLPCAQITNLANDRKCLLYGFNIIAAIPDISALDRTLF